MRNSSNGLTLGGAKEFQARFTAMLMHGTKYLAETTRGQNVSTKLFLFYLWDKRGSH